MDRRSISYARQKLDLLSDTLEKPVVVDSLGEKYDRIVDCASRLVVVTSLDDSLSSPKLKEPGVIPIVPTPNLGEFAYAKGSFQFSTRQAEIVDSLLSEWGSKATIHELDSAFDAAAESLVGVRFDFQQNTEALNSCVATIFSHDEASAFFSAPHVPSAKLMRVALRPALAIAPVRSYSYDTSDMIVHELVHNIQKEDAPITLFNSQQDVINESVRCELEAYHYGALVRMAMMGFGSLNEYVETAFGTNLQLDIESARQHYQHSDDPFEPNKTVINGVAKVTGIPNFYSIGIDINDIVNEKKAQQRALRVKKLPPSAKRSQGRTTPKSSR